MSSAKSDSSYRPLLTAGQSVVLCTFALLAIGVVMVNSAGMSIDPKRAVTFESIVLSRSTVYMALAMVAMGVIALLPIRKLAHAAVSICSLDRDPQTLSDAFTSLRPFAYVVGALMVLLAAVYLPVIGREVNGSHRWIALPVGAGGENVANGGLSVQPSELAKWGLILVIACYGATRQHLLGKFWLGLVPALVIVGAVAGFVIIEDLGTGALIGAVAALLLIAAGARFWHFLAMLPIGIVALAAAVAANPYRITRITTFMDPYKEPERSGYHLIQSMVSVANGQIFGRGLGFGLQKFGYLPEDRTDFLFAVICEELGLIGAALVVGLYLILIWSGLAVVRRERDLFLKLAGLGVIATIGLQAIINIAVVTGMAPTKGIALPMLSSGGTGWILTAASLGLLVAIDRSRADEHAALPELTSPVTHHQGAPVVVTGSGRSWPAQGARRTG